MRSDITSHPPEIYQNHFSPDVNNLQISAVPFEKFPDGQFGENSTQKGVNPMSITSSLNKQKNLLLDESKKMADELEMKIDKAEDLILNAKESKLEDNLKSLDKSLELIDAFKRFNIDQTDFNPNITQNISKNNINGKVEDEV